MGAEKLTQAERKAKARTEGHLRLARRTLARRELAARAAAMAVEGR